MSRLVEPRRHAGNLYLIGGWLCLDFANTVDWHNSDHPHEWLTSYADLVSWSLHAGILADTETQHLLADAERQPRDAATVLKRAIVLREAIFNIFKAVAQGLAPKINDLAILNSELFRALTKLRVVSRGKDFEWAWKGEDEDSLDRMLWPVAKSAADLLTSEKLTRVRMCEGKDCGWLFLDMSRNRSRRWCVMEDCGNRAKARRYYQRKRAAHY